MPPFRLKIERLEDACNVQKVIKFCDFITITGMVYKKKKKKVCCLRSRRFIRKERSNDGSVAFILKISMQMLFLVATSKSKRRCLPH